MASSPAAYIQPSAFESFSRTMMEAWLAGTLVFALLAVADRFSPRRVFLACSLAGAALAAATALLPPTLTLLIVLRFATGVCLAGIYPVGMKIAAGWYAQGLGWALGVLVGADHRGDRHTA